MQWLNVEIGVAARRTIEDIIESKDALSEGIENFIETANVKEDFAAIKYYSWRASAVGLVDILVYLAGINPEPPRLFGYLGLIIGTCVYSSYKGLVHSKEAPLIKEAKKAVRENNDEEALELLRAADNKKISKFALVTHAYLAAIIEDASYFVFEKIVRVGKLVNPYPVNNWWKNYWDWAQINGVHFMDPSPGIGVPIGYLPGIFLTGAYMFKKWLNGRKNK